MICPNSVSMKLRNILFYNYKQLHRLQWFHTATHFQQKTVLIIKIVQLIMVNVEILSLK